MMDPINFKISNKSFERNFAHVRLIDELKTINSQVICVDKHQAKHWDDSRMRLENIVVLI